MSCHDGILLLEMYEDTINWVFTTTIKQHSKSNIGGICSLYKQNTIHESLKFSFYACDSNPVIYNQCKQY